MPPSLESREAIERGRLLFERNCRLCHGELGDGRGTRSANFSSDPRDFNSAAWAESTTPRKTFYSIREGVRGTAMPSWKSLSEDETWDLVAFVLSLGTG